jgi:NAD(P)-dependent dehydrogenase (short-subunit alcohol dehydrogenase family)
MPMLMSVADEGSLAPRYPELAGKRVLIAGITASLGVDIVRAFAEHRTRLVLQFQDMSEPAQAIAEVAAPAALEMRAFGPIDRTSEAAATFARTAAQAFGGLDVAINLVPLCMTRIPGATATTGDVEQLVARQLLATTLIGRIAANRMGLLWRDGLVLNIAALAARLEGRTLAFAALIKAALTHITRRQAEAWASQAIRCNAIAPQTALPGEQVGEPEIAALALYLASDLGRELSGHVFEAEQACERAPDLVRARAPAEAALG